MGVKLNLKKLVGAPLPCILYWNANHYVVLYRIKKKKYYISDPAHGLISYSKDEFIKFWIGNNATEATEEGIALLLEPTPRFYESEFDGDKKNTFGFGLLFKYLIPYKSYVFQLAVGLLAGSFLQLILPFLTQSVVDVGIQNQNIHFIYLILFAQLFLFIGRTALELIRSWILLHLSARINISLISDFFYQINEFAYLFF